MIDKLRGVFLSTYVFLQMLSPTLSMLALVTSLTVASRVYRGAVSDTIVDLCILIGLWFAFASLMGAKEHHKCRDCVLLVVDRSDLEKICNKFSEQTR